MGDIGRLPLWFTDQALWAQAQKRRFILEDRHLAIQNAIFAANDGDVVVIAGRGNQQYQEWIGRHVYDAEAVDPCVLEQMVKGWFDDRIVCREAIAKLLYLQTILPASYRRTFPWLFSNTNLRHPL